MIWHWSKVWRSSSSRDRRKVLGRRRRRLRGRTYWGQTNTEEYSLSSNVEADDLNTANSDGGAGVDGWTDGRMTSVAAAALVLVPTAIWLPTNCRNKSLAHFKIKFISPDCYPRSSCKSVNFLWRTVAESGVTDFHSNFACAMALFLPSRPAASILSDVSAVTHTGPGVEIFS